jgi:tetratricopeptide (TPR) repeat protein
MKKRIIAIAILLIGLKAEAQSSVFAVVENLLLDGNYQEALLQLDNESIPTLEIYDKKGSIYQSVGNYTKAIKNYKKALEIKESSIIKGKLGKVYELASLSTNAIKTYEEIIQKDSANLLIANSLGKLYLRHFQPKKGAEIFVYLKKKDSLNPNYPYRLGKALEMKNEPFKMADNYLEAFEIDSLHVKSMYGLAKFYKQLNDKDSTMLFIDKGLKIDKNSLNFNQLKANALYKAKDYRGAIKHLKRLDSLNYKSAGIFEMLGMSYSRLEENELALEYFDKAISMDRDNPTVYYRKAVVLYEMKDNKKASYTLMYSIYSSKPDLHRQYYLLGTIQKEEGNSKKAIQSFKKSIENNSKNYKSLFELALLSDSYYKDKKIAFELYDKFITRFEKKDVDMTLIANARLKEIKKDLFMNGVVVD